MKRILLRLTAAALFLGLMFVVFVNAAMYLHCNSIDSSIAETKLKLDHAQTQVELLPKSSGEPRKYLLSSSSLLLKEVETEGSDAALQRMIAVVRHYKWPGIINREYFKKRLIASDHSLLHVGARIEALKAIKSQYDEPATK